MFGNNSPSGAQIRALLGLGGPQRVTLDRPKVSFPAPRPSAGTIKATPKRSIARTIEDTTGDLLRRAGVDQHDANRWAGKLFGAFNDLTPVGNVTGAQEGYGLLKQGITRGELATGAAGLGSLLLSVVPFGGTAKKKPLQSLMRDESGAIRAYHGGPAFDGNFDIAKAGDGIGHANEQAIWFTPDAEEANRYAWNVGEPGYGGKAVYPATIDDTDFGVVHPLRYDNDVFVRWLEDARAAGRKGVIFKAVREDARVNPADQIAVLDPSRIKF